MAKATDIRICDARATTQYFKYRAPAKFGGRTVTDVVLLDVVVDVETRDGRRGRGFGSMPVGNIWAWPSQELSTEQTLAAMIIFGQLIVRRANDYQGTGHALEITHELSNDLETEAEIVVHEFCAPRADAAAGPARRRESVGSRDSRRLRQSPWAELLQFARAEFVSRRSLHVSHSRLRRRVSRSLHAPRSRSRGCRSII